MLILIGISITKRRIDSFKASGTDKERKSVSIQRLKLVFFEVPTSIQNKIKLIIKVIAEEK